MVTASSEPQGVLRPVVAPNSRPRLGSIGANCASSVGNAPSPTRVEYAFITPTTRSIRCGGTPVPVQAPPAVVFEEVTYGYVPWSISRNVPCAPSNKICLPRYRPRHVSVCNFLKHDSGRRLHRHGRATASDGSCRRRDEGLLDASGGWRTAYGGRAIGADASQSRPRIRRDNGTQTPLRLVRRCGGSLRRHYLRPRRYRDHQSGWIRSRR